MEKFRTIIGEKKEEPKRELAEVVQEVRQMAEQTPAQPEPAVAPREATDVGQFMRFVASTIAKLPPVLNSPQVYCAGYERQVDRRDIQKHRLAGGPPHLGPQQNHVT